MSCILIVSVRSSRQQRLTRELDARVGNLFSLTLNGNRDNILVVAILDIPRSAFPSDDSYDGIDGVKIHSMAASIALRSFREVRIGREEIREETWRCVSLNVKTNSVLELKLLCI